MTTVSTDHQKIVDAHFRTAAGYWKQIYDLDDVNAAIHQYRREQVLSLVKRLDVPKSARVLEIGCGAGTTSVALAEQGYRIDAVDTVEAMVNSTRELARRAGVESLVHASAGDVHGLPAKDGAYDLVLTIGVLPWLSAVERPLAEMRRVLRAGGALIVNVDNKWSLHRFVDPRLNPFTQPLKHALRDILRHSGLRDGEAVARTMSRGRFDRELGRAGFSRIASLTLGFGPFTWMRRQAAEGRWQGRINRRLQQWADSGVPVIRGAGSQYLVAARRGK